MAACASAPKGGLLSAVTATRPAAATRAPGRETDDEFIAAHLTDPNLPELLRFHGRLRDSPGRADGTRQGCARQRAARPGSSLVAGRDHRQQSATEPRWETPEESGDMVVEGGPTELRDAGRVLTTEFDHAAKGAIPRTLGMALAGCGCSRGTGRR
jgi:hypothetical protein